MCTNIKSNKDTNINTNDKLNKHRLCLNIKKISLWLKSTNVCMLNYHAMTRIYIAHHHCMSSNFSSDAR